MKSKHSVPTGSTGQIRAFIEKRTYLRDPLFVLQVKWKQFDKVFLGRAENISIGGMFLSSDRPLQVGEKFSMEFILPDRKTKVVCMGEVVWTRQYTSEGAGSQGVGVRFIDLDEKKMKLVEIWIRKQETRSKKKA